MENKRFRLPRKEKKRFKKWAGYKKRILNKHLRFEYLVYKPFIKTISS